MTRSIPTTILDKIKITINDYEISKEPIIYISYSGGKDSFFLCIALRELGYQVVPVIVDVGYNSLWNTAINNMLGLGFKVQILDIDYAKQNMPEIIPKLTENFKYILAISNGLYERASICTPCYNSKSIMLQSWMSKNGIFKIANGHHATDAVASFLKSYYYYVDRWEYEHEKFRSNEFKKLILSQKYYFNTNISNFMDSIVNIKLEELNREGVLGTDEPIMQRMGESQMTLCRPLFSVFEYEIRNYFVGTGYGFNPSECYSTNTRDKNKQTPREMIQAELLDNSPAELLTYLHNMVKKTLNEKGYSFRNIRNVRNSVLGDAYKSEVFNDWKM